MILKNPIYTAIKSLRKHAEFGLINDDFSTLIWLEDENVIPKPTKEEVMNEVARLQAEYEANEYKEQRAAEYPDFRDYLDGIVKGDQAQVQAYIDACNAVKNKYPKGQA